MTVGGNDLLAAYGNATAARQAIDTVVSNGSPLLAGLRALTGPEAPIVVATVHDPSDGSGDAGRLGLPPWRQALRLLAELNQALRTLATEHRALVADVQAVSLPMAWLPGIPHSRPHVLLTVACGTAV